MSVYIYTYTYTYICIITLLRVIIAVMREQLGTESIYVLLTLPYHCLSSNEVMIGTQTGQEPGVKSRHRDHGGVLLSVWISQACSA